MRHVGRTDHSDVASAAQNCWSSAVQHLVEMRVDGDGNDARPLDRRVIAIVHGEVGAELDRVELGQ